MNPPTRSRLGELLSIECLRLPSIMLLLAFVMPGLAQAEQADPRVEDTVSGVVRLLENEVSEEIVLKWVESRGGVGGSLSSEILIELQKAGASDDLLASLLAGSSAASTEDASSSAGEADPEVVAVGESTREEGGLADPVADEAASPAKPAAPEQVPVTWRMRNAGGGGFDEEGGERRRDLSIYLDGRLFERLPTSFSRSGETERESYLSPGLHSIRLTRDLHELTSKKRNSWLHEVRVFPGELSFEVGPQGDCLIEVVYSESSLGLSKTPITLRVTQGGIPLAEIARTTSDPDRWPRLCEAISASFADDKQDSLAARVQLKDCQSFTDLWPADAEADWSHARDAIRKTGPTE